MDTEKRNRLEANGWRAGSAEAFLDLSVQEAASVELQLVLEREETKWRETRGNDPAE